MKDLYRQAHKVLASINNASILVLIVLQVFILAVPYLRDYIKPIDTEGKLTFVLMCLHLLLGSISIYISYKIKDLIRLTKLDQIEQECESYKLKVSEQQAFIARLASYPFALQWSITILNEIIHDNSKIKNTKEGIEKLLEPLVQARASILGYQGDDLYNIAVYLFNDKSGELEILYRTNDNRIVTHGRNWKPPFGHVGYAYATNTLLITSNFPEESILSEDTRFSSDKEYYASFISAPIPGVHNDGNPLGVLVITSSRSDQFDKEDKELYSLIVNYSMILSVYFLAVIGSKKNSYKLVKCY